MFILVLSMWGKTASDEWLYIGNQYVYNTPMTQEQCENRGRTCRRFYRRSLSVLQIVINTIKENKQWLQ